VMETLGFDRHHLHQAYAQGSEPAAVIAKCLRRIAAVGDPGIFLHLATADVLRAAAAALPPFDPERFPLWGLPFAVKDNIDVAGMPTTAACPAFAYLPEADAPVVARLRAAGAIPVGKTNLDQFATGLVGVRTPYPVPRNALDPTIVPGGSSSGSALAVAHGLVTFALGTDTAGSGRVPAALNNIVGLKPSLGALSTRGVVPACRTLDCVSIFALVVDDAWAAFAAAAAFDPDDPFSRDRPAGGYGPCPATPRIGVPTAASLRFFGDAAQARMFEAAIADLEAMGATAVPVDLEPFYAVAALLYEGAWVAERLAAIESFMASHPKALHPTTQAIIGGAGQLSAVDAFKGLYRLAELRRALEPVVATVDLLVVPSIPGFVSLEEITADPIGPNSRLGIYTNFVNLLDMAAIAVPTRPRADGRPGSVTLLAPGGADGRIAAVARALQARSGADLGATGRAVEPTPPPAATVGPGEIEIVVVGAHMRGMALSPELTRAGGRFLRATTTTSRYRLWALAGMTPPRPGLTRAAPEDPAAGPIEAEVWALPEAAFARLTASIPAPLSIGTLELADGTSPKGFLAEVAGTKGALDITALGSWRRYCAGKA
jgi:allophanate hydrolase